MLSIPNSTKGSFNNNVDQILPNFDPYHPRVDILHNKLIFNYVTKRRLSTNHLPTSPSPRLY